MSTQKHLQNVSGYPDSLAELANALGDLRYDALAEFLNALSQKLEQDGEKDEARGRKQLARALSSSSGALKHASQEIETAWRICKPYMQDEPTV